MDTTQAPRRSSELVLFSLLVVAIACGDGPAAMEGLVDAMEGAGDAMTTQDAAVQPREFGEDRAGAVLDKRGELKIRT